MRPFALLLVLLTAGCPYVGPEKYYEDVQDWDGDGVAGTRFGGDDCLDHDANVRYCDEDGDGFLVPAAGGDDCDDKNPEVHPGLTFFADRDGDTWGNGADSTVGCLVPTGYVKNGADCNDSDATVYPTAIETCEPVDQNCDGDPIAGADKTQWFVDADGDGAGSSEIDPNASCQPGPNQASNDDDCDDANPGVHPSTPANPVVDEWYDGVDTDCDGANDFDQDGDNYDANTAEHFGTDCDDRDPDMNPGAPEVCDGEDDDCDLLVDDADDDADQVGQITYYLDADRDGHAGLIASQWCSGEAPAEWKLSTTDCNDAIGTVHPDAVEFCNVRDDDCNGAVDDVLPENGILIYPDADGDTYGDLAQQVLSCSILPGHVTRAGDCLDTDPATNPEAEEVCGDAIRQDCQPFSVDDCDADGEEAESAGGTDCADEDPLVNTSALEVCDTIDNDCDDLVDSQDDVDPQSFKDFFYDLDGDGHGGTQLAASATCEPPANAVASSDDCDDTRDFVYPAAEEQCNDLDDDCDGSADEGPVESAPDLYYDYDGDGAGTPVAPLEETCDPDPSLPLVTLAGDCDDDDPDRGPLADETCDGVDNDCDLLTDDADPDVVGAAPIWYRDTDGDGYGQPTSILRSCTAPAGYSTMPGDCNDMVAAANPGAVEVCNGGLDDDCDGLADDLDEDIGGGAGLTWYADTDGDGYGDPAVSVTQCGAPAKYVANFLDCDDTDPSVSPAAVEVCNGGVDDDCDALADDEGPYVLGGFPWYADADGDGIGAGKAFLACEEPVAAAALPGDCDDTDAAISPFAAEVCDTLDNDCDGLADGMDPSTIGQPWFLDGDGDGYGGLTIALGCDLSTMGYTQVTGDCNDSTASIHPAATETCDGADQDCDAAVDEGAVGADWLIDADGDGAGSAAVIAACVQPFGTVATGGDADCDDDDATAYPGNPIELCDDVDNDCDSFLDEADPDTFVFGSVAYLDDDGDGFGVLPGVACRIPYVDDGYVGFPGDCDDGDPFASPIIDEICDGIDNDCDNAIDDACDTGGAGTPGECVPVTWYDDDDGDGYGDPDDATVACTAPADHVDNASDCNDALAGDVQVTVVATGADLAAAVTVGACELVLLAPGFDDVVSLVVPAGATASIASENPAAPGVLRMSGSTPIIEFTNPGSLVLEDVSLVGGAGGELVKVDQSAAALVITDALLDGGGGSAGLYVDEGDVVLSGVRFEDTEVVGRVGTAIHVLAKGSLAAYDVTIHGAEGDSAVALDLTGDDISVDRLVLWDSDRVYVFGKDEATFTEVELYRSDLDALVVDKDAVLHLDQLLILDPGGDGLKNLDKSIAVATGVTIVGAGGDGVEATSMLLNDAIVHDSAGVDLRELKTLTYDHILYDDAAGTPTGLSRVFGVPGFVSYAPGEPLDMVDLHLGATSDADGAGIAGGDLGYYLATDSWYDDADLDGLPDGWEGGWFLTLANDGADDSDGDGWTNATELANGTSPALRDTDGDTVEDDVDATPLVP